MNIVFLRRGQIFFIASMGNPSAPGADLMFADSMDLSSSDILKGRSSFSFINVGKFV